MIYNVYRRKSKFYIVDSNGYILKDNIEQVKVKRSTTSSTLFEFYSDDIGSLSIEVADIRTRTGLTFQSANAFEYWADHNTGESADLEDDIINYAATIILENYGHIISVEEKAKTLTKFGRNENIGTSYATLWYTGKDQANEAIVEDNLNTIDTISSSNAADAIKISIEGHTMTGGNKTFIVQTATLNGQNKVTLTTPLNMITRIAHSDETHTNILGEVYGYENTTISAGKPVDTTKIHITVPAGENQSQKAQTALSSVDYWIIRSISAGYLSKTGSNTAQVDLQIRKNGGVFKPVAKPLVMATGDSDSRTFDIPIIATPNSIIRLVGKSSASSQALTGDISGYLAKVIV